MSEIAYEIECSVEAEASLAFAWEWRTDVKNWVDPPAEFHLDGPFAAGSWGITSMPGREPLRWHIREVEPGRRFIIDMPLDRATLSFEWRFGAVSDRRTKITQHLVLSGDNAGDHTAQVQAAFSATLVDGMKRIAAVMATAEATTRSGESSGLVVVEEGGVRVLEGSPDREFLRRAKDAARLVEACFSARVKAALLYPSNLTDEFFDVSSGDAGAVLQKLRDYRIRLAVVCVPGSVRFSSRFGEMVAEESRGNYFRLFESRQRAREWLNGSGRHT